MQLTHHNHGEDYTRESREAMRFTRCSLLMFLFGCLHVFVFNVPSEDLSLTKIPPPANSTTGKVGTSWQTK